MKVVLFESVSGLGNRGDVVDVSDGYGRNSLIPKGLAQKATEGTKAQADLMKKAWEQRNAKNREAAEELAKSLVAKPIIIYVKAGGEGKLFGSVTTSDIASSIAEQSGVEVDRKMITLSDPIRTLGSYSVAVKPHPEVQFPVSVEVLSE